MITGTIRTLLPLLLLLATAATREVGAKVSVSRTRFSSSTHRYLQNDGDPVEAFLSDHSSNQEVDTSNNSDEYVPYPHGTAIRYHDQDGTWMDGKIVNYNSDSKTYTIQWDEDNVNEDFSDLAKIDQLVLNAAKKPIATATDDDNGDQNNDWNSDKEVGDVPGFPSKGSSPKDFDFNYTYTYNDLTEYEPWPLGTMALLEFADGYYEGKITNYSMSEDKTNATYIVTWSDGTSDSFVNELEWMDLMVENAKNYDPWSIGTPAYGYPNPLAQGAVSKASYLEGKITAFEGGAYTITWSNGDALDYSDFDRVDELVYNAALNSDPDKLDSYEPWPLKTPVSWDFDDGWWDGTITAFKDGTYEVTWSDGTKKDYSNLDKVDQMVAFRAGEGFIGDDGSGDDGNGNGGYDGDNQSGDDFYTKSGYFPAGTLVYAEFKDGWWAGYIDGYDDEYYVIRWSDDSSDNFLPGKAMDEMVDNAQYIASDFDLYPEGTMVYSEFNGDWYYGTVDFSSHGFYEVLWEDGERSIYVAGDTFDQMVKNAYSNGIGLLGTVGIAFLAVAGMAGISFFVIERNKKRRRLVEITEQVQENELDMAEGIGLELNKNAYSDEPRGNNGVAVV